MQEVRKVLVCDFRFELFKGKTVVEIKNIKQKASLQKAFKSSVKALENSKLIRKF